MGKKRIGLALLITTLAMTVFFICITLEEIYFVSSILESFYLMLIIVFLILALILLLKNDVLQQLLIIFVGIIGLFVLFHSTLKFITSNSIDYRKLKNCDKVIFKGNDFSGLQYISFGELYCFNLLYKRTSRLYLSNIYGPDENLDQYELPEQYQNTEHHELIFAEDESMLIDLDNDLAYKLMKKVKSNDL